jgi:hypothetical protein
MIVSTPVQVFLSYPILEGRHHKPCGHSKHQTDSTDRDAGHEKTKIRRPEKAARGSDYPVVDAESPPCFVESVI